MRIQLNVLPEERKRLIRRRYILSVVLRQCVLIFLMMFTTVSALTMVWLSVAHQRRAVEESASLHKDANERYRDLEEYENSFALTNKKLILSERVFSLQKTWTRPLEEITKIVPAEITIQGVSFKDEGGSLLGVSENRDTLLQFEESMKEIGCFSQVSLPISSLTQRSNTSFEMEFLVTKECLYSGT